MNNTEKGNLAWFPSLDVTDQSLLSDVTALIQVHLQQLLNAFDGYFYVGNLEPSDCWIQNLFTSKPSFETI